MPDRPDRTSSADRIGPAVQPLTLGCLRAFGEELRRRRTGAGMTLRSLAVRVVFDYSYLAQVERGDRAGSATLARRCDQVLDAQGHLVRLFADRKVRQLMHEVRGDA